MRDLAPDPQAPDTELVAEPACYPGGACGPIVETPLLELAFNRLRDLTRGRTAADAAHSAMDPPVGPFVLTAPAVTASPVRPPKDAPHD